MTKQTRILDLTEGHRPAAVLLDMDGTLTEPLLDFAAIKAEMGIGNQPILESIARMSPDEQAQARAVLDRHEEAAARDSTLNPGCAELLAWLDERRVPKALITRNSPASVQTVVARHRLSIDVLITRDDAPPKPDPAPLHLACRRLGVDAGDVWMIGDGIHDIEAGLAAGIRTVWLSHRRPRSFAATPWREVADLFDLAALLEACCTPK